MGITSITGNKTGDVPYETFNLPCVTRALRHRTQEVYQSFTNRVQLTSENNLQQEVDVEEFTNQTRKSLEEWVYSPSFLSFGAGTLNCSEQDFEAFLKDPNGVYVEVKKESVVILRLIDCKRVEIHFAKASNEDTRRELTAQSSQILSHIGAAYNKVAQVNPTRIQEKRFFHSFSEQKWEEAELCSFKRELMKKETAYFDSYDEVNLLTHRDLLTQICVMQMVERAKRLFQLEELCTNFLNQQGIQIRSNPLIKERLKALEEAGKNLMDLGQDEAEFEKRRAEFLLFAGGLVQDSFVTRIAHLNEFSKNPSKGIHELENQFVALERRYKERLAMIPESEMRQKEIVSLNHALDLLLEDLISAEQIVYRSRQQIDQAQIALIEKLRNDINKLERCL